MRQINDTPGSRVVRRAQQALADVLRRNQHPIRLKVVNLLFQNRGAFDGVRHCVVFGRRQLDLLVFQLMAHLGEFFGSVGRERASNYAAGVPARGQRLDPS